MKSFATAGSRLLACAVALVLAAPSGAQAAQVTRVASSFEPQNPFDLDLEVGFARTQRRGKITREAHQEGALTDVLELRYTQITQQLPMRLALGLYHDIELHVGASLVFNDTRMWGFPAADTNETNSTIINNCVNPDGTSISGCTQSNPVGAQAIFTVPGQSYRAGLSNLTFGLSWAPLNDRKDDSKPKWVLGFDYTASTADLANPSVPTTEGNTGPVGDKVQRLHFTTALSKRMGAIDPYVKINYSLPMQGSGFYSNCDNPAALGYGSNCGGDTWTSRETGVKAPHVAGLLFGAEFYAYDEPARHQAVSFDLQLGGQYVSEGRSFNELSDALGKLLYSEEYLSVGGTFGVNARAAEYVQLKLSASLYHDTEHFLTNESIGKDLTGNNQVDIGRSPEEINPNFDFRYDMPGRRFRISEVSVFTVMATGIVNF